MARKIYDNELKIDKKTWKKIINNNEITDQNTQNILDILLHSNNYEERGGIIAKKLKYSHHVACNSIIKSYGNRIKENYPEYKYPEDLFHIPLLGEKRNGYFYWKLRPLLAKALEEDKT
jgi:hypothetical protein